MRIALQDKPPEIKKKMEKTGCVDNRASEPREADDANGNNVNINVINMYAGLGWPGWPAGCLDKLLHSIELSLKVSTWMHRFEYPECFIHFLSTCLTV